MVQHVTQNKNRIIKHVNVTVKIIVSAKKDYSWNPSKWICGNNRYVKIIAEALIIMGVVSKKKTNTVATKKTSTIVTNVMSTASIICLSKSVGHCYILYMTLIVIIWSCL